MNKPIIDEISLEEVAWNLYFIAKQNTKKFVPSPLEIKIVDKQTKLLRAQFKNVVENADNFFEEAGIKPEQMDEVFEKYGQKGRPYAEYLYYKFILGCYL